MLLLKTALAIARGSRNNPVRRASRWLRGGAIALVGVLSALPGLALELRVAVGENLGQVTVGSSTAARVRDRSGAVLGDLDRMNAFVARSTGGGVAIDRWQDGMLWLEPKNGGHVYVGDRWYRGKLLLVPGRDGLTVVNYVDLEAYIYSVLGAEMSPDWHIEALKAQAVAARSYVLYQRERYGNDTYDVGDDTFWQVYLGMEEESRSTHRAAEATRGQVLSYDGVTIEAVFHASSGGHTEDVEQVWDEHKPYLRGVPDFDRDSPYYQWTESMSAWEVSQRLGGVGTVTGLFPERQSPKTGRLVDVRVVGTGGTAIVDGDDVRSALGLRSSLFSVVFGGGYFTFSGRGFGHGVGMSQWGAKYLAEQGYNYRQILNRYYSNTQLARVRAQ